MQAFIVKSSGIKLNPLGFGQEFGHITAFHILLGQLCWVKDNILF